MRLLWIFIVAVSCWAGELASGPLRERVDLNNAPQDLIEKLPGVGPKIAKEIIAHRPFREIDDLDHVKGIGPKKLERIRPYVFILPMRGPLPVRPAAPATNRIERININTASLKELQKIPGVGPKRAAEIARHRPYARPEDLMKIRGLKQAQFERMRDFVKVN